jgi:hypothetical protein
MGFMLIVPEFMVGKAFQDYIMAWISCNEMEELALQDGVEWTMVHGFYANMGGDHSNLAINTDTANESHHADARQIQDLTLEAFSDAQRNENMNDHQPESTIPPNKEISNAERAKLQELEDGGELQEQLFCITAHELYESRLTKTIPSLPSISTFDISDKSKGDPFVKGLAIVQVLWLLIQVAIRTAKNLPVSQLEIVVLAFSFCTLITYLLCWSKPQNVMVPTYIVRHGVQGDSGEVGWVFVAEEDFSWSRGDEDGAE